MLTATIADVLSWYPCDHYDEHRIRELATGRESFTALDVLTLDIPIQDRFWVVLRPELIDERTLHLFMCDCAEHVLPLFEREHPDDDRPRRAIEIARRYARGEATRAELAAASSAAWDAAYAAAWDAASAASAAACAARDAAWDASAAACAAASAAEIKWQLDRLVEMLTNGPDTAPEPVLA